MPKHKSGNHMQHHHGDDEDHLQGKPLLKRGLEEDQRRAAADGDDRGRRGHADIDESGQPVQAVEIRPVRERRALPEQEGQDEQPARPHCNRGEMDEFQQDRHRAGSRGRRLDQASQSPTPR
jgi:hypothetical protein